jgi:hypothetical protein
MSSPLPVKGLQLLLVPVIVTASSQETFYLRLLGMRPKHVPLAELTDTPDP